MSFSDIEHFSNMVTGCESLNAHFYNKEVAGTEAHYAFSVLKLHAADAGHVAGTEGFLDAVKKGAKKGKEWLLQLIQYIKDFIKGISRDDRERINTINELSKKIKWEEYDFNDQTFQYATPLGRVIALTNDSSVISELRSALSEIDKKHVANFITKLTRASTLLKGHVEDLNRKVEAETSKLGKDESPSKELSEKAKDLKNNTEAANGLSMIINKMASDMSKHYDRWKAQHESNKGRQESLNKEKAELEKGRNK